MWTCLCCSIAIDNHVKVLAVYKAIMAW